VDSRSSQNPIGSGVSRSRLRAKARVDWQRGPSVPSMLSGNPITSPAISRARAISISRPASAVNFVRRTVSSGEATDRIRSDTATPIVFSPKSRPMRAPTAGSAAAKAVISPAIN
jgi:hypothetical protein